MRSLLLMLVLQLVRRSIMKSLLLMLVLQLVRRNIMRSLLLMLVQYCGVCRRI